MFTLDLELLFIGGENQHITGFRLSDNTVHMHFKAHEGTVNCLATKKARTIVSAGQEGLLKGAC